MLNEYLTSSIYIQGRWKRSSKWCSNETVWGRPHTEPSSEIISNDVARASGIFLSKGFENNNNNKFIDF